jgi:recombination protein RecA
MADQTALARATSLNFRTLALYAEELNICVIFLNQTRTKPGVIYGDPTTTPGGDSPKFYASVRIQLGTTRLMKKEGDESVMLGAEITARCVKNKVYRPYMKAKWRFMFQEDGSGKFDSIGSLVDLLADRGVITKAGAYLVWDGKKYHRGPLVALLEATPGSLDLLNDMLVGAGIVPEEEKPSDEAPVDDALAVAAE